MKRLWSTKFSTEHSLSYVVAIIISRELPKLPLKLLKQCPAIVIPLDFPVYTPIYFSFYCFPLVSTEGSLFSVLDSMVTQM